jgi:pimeloyl-ACP methyl ester carboxylesterase
MGRTRSALAAACIGVPVALAAAIAVRSWRSAVAEFFPARQPIGWPAAAPPPEGKADVQFASSEGDLIRAWYVPSRNGAGVALVHGTDSDRTHFVPEIGELSARGFGVLAYDEPGCGESGGRVTWGRSERAALRAALGWLRDTAHLQHLGVIGFSQGAYIAAQVAPDDDRVEALVLEGAVASFREQTWHEYGRWGALSEWPAWLSRRAHGYVPSDAQPEEVLARFHRPVFFIGGDADRVVPASSAGKLFALAPGPKERWIVPGAHHGDYARVAPAEYGARLAAFFGRALLR